MKKQIWMEYRKLWNKIAGVAVISMCVVVVLHLLIYLNLQYRSIDSRGEIVEGLASYRALREASKELEGVMDGEYIQNLIISYNSSFDKAYMVEHKGFLGTGGMTKYMVPNYFINYAYYGPYMSNGNNKVGLDYDFLESEEMFYTTYKEMVKEHLEDDNLYTNMYTDEQLLVLNKKVDNLKTPFSTGYYQGLANLRSWYIMDYSLVFFVLVFGLAGLFAKDNAGGITELTLSSQYGRKKNLNARWIAGNLFIASVYLIYLGTQLVVNGLIGTLDGWNVSAQMMWFTCLYNMTFGTGLLIMFVGGLLGALVVGNVVMLFSIKTKNMKLAAILSAVTVAMLTRTTNMYSIGGFLSPMNFERDYLVDIYMFIGNTAVPYFIVVFILTALYVAILYINIRMSYKKYHIN
ncbi:MAG: hypothetical protein K2N73_01270 [Lachnospiraceae bacterium]|nr:hypothetical protein [Lachnospiraceae bacterium]